MRVIGLQLLLVGMLLPLYTRQRGNMQLGSRPGAQYTEFAANMDRNGTGKLHSCEKHYDPPNNVASRKLDQVKKSTQYRACRFFKGSKVYINPMCLLRRIALCLAMVRNARWEDSRLDNIAATSNASYAPSSPGLAASHDGA